MAILFLEKNIKIFILNKNKKCRVAIYNWYAAADWWLILRCHPRLNELYF